VSPPVVVGHIRKRNLLGENFAYCFTLRGNVVIKVGHNVRTAVYCGRGLILGYVRHPVTAKPTYRVLIYDEGFCIMVWSVGLGYGLKIAN